MPIKLWSHLCHYAYSDASGNTSVIGIFSNIASNIFPAHVTIITVACGWECVPEETFHPVVRICSETGEVICTRDNGVIHTPAQALTRIHLTTSAIFTDVIFKKPGQYAAEIMSDNITIDSINFGVHSITKS